MAKVKIMILAENFFEDIDNPTAFSCGLEETVAYITYLDMFLQVAREEDLYEIVKVNEATEGKENPDPRFQGELQPEDFVRDELLKASAYLNARTKLTAGMNFSLEGGMPVSHAAEKYGINGFAFICLLLATAPFVDEKYSLLYRQLRKDELGHGMPTFALAERLFSYVATEDEMVLARMQRGMIDSCPLFRITQCADDSTELNDGFTISRQYSALLKGDFLIGEEMGAVSVELPILEPQNPSQISLMNAFASFSQNSQRLVHLCGKHGVGKKYAVQCATDKSAVLAVNVPQFLRLEAEDSKEILREVLVRAKLLNDELVFCDMYGSEEMKTSCASIIDSSLRVLDRVVFTTINSDFCNATEFAYDYFKFMIELPKADERLKLWKEFTTGMPLDEDVMLERFASLYAVTAGVIKSAVSFALANANAKGHDKVAKEDLTKALMSYNSAALSKLATPLKGNFAMEDLQISDSQKNILKLACSRVINKGKVEDEWGFGKKFTYGKGNSILLYGAPGTGKTMAATVIANEIGMELYRVDLSQMVDKYVGETEKNIGKVFDAASEGNFILFFDEADSLFSKRTDVNDSNDKHANTEVSYLLQKMEAYDGLSILATNRFSNFDTAFVRRITYVINLDKPDEPTRRKLWEAAFPKEAPVSKDIDLDFFAREFDLTGSVIKNAVVNAAYMAARDDEPISNAHLVNAVYMEEKKNGHMLSDDKFKQYGGFLVK